MKQSKVQLLANLGFASKLRQFLIKIAIFHTQLGPFLVYFLRSARIQPRLLIQLLLSLTISDRYSRVSIFMFTQSGLKLVCDTPAGNARLLKAEEAQGPPAEREQLHWKATV
ncbi:hypothetical protein [Peribacillus muralis]|uniref:hypothetical protein n=1 Tax=Peribacillus muralis TaxID=264697 RepID=UPI00366B87C1